MAIKRVPIEAVADPQHGRIFLEGEGSDQLPADRVYVNPRSGAVCDGRRGHKLRDLRGDEMEIPRTTWF